MTNICKYAYATTVQIQIHTTADGLELILQDNGKGFEIDSHRNGFGLQGMQERIAALGGNLEVVELKRHFPKLSTAFH